jgi:hypothetical protein
MARRRYKLIGEILDDQMRDRNDCAMGKVDGIVLVLRDGKPPRVVAIESGFAVLMRRLSKRLARLAIAIGRRLGVRDEPCYRIDWKHVKHVKPYGLELDLDATATGVYAWEHWLREHVVNHLPFAR